MLRRLSVAAAGVVTVVATTGVGAAPAHATPPNIPSYSTAVTRLASLTVAAESLLAWIADTLGDRPVGLLGFSQGGAVAVQTLRVAPDAVSFAVVLAGYAAGGELPGDIVLAERRPPVFWGRGSRDDVIPPHLIDMTAQWLPAHSDLTGRVYPGLTHSVSEEELADVRAFLDARLAGGTADV